MQRTVFVHSEKQTLPVGLSPLDLADTDRVLHIVFPSADARLDDTQLKSFTRIHERLEFRAHPQLLLVVLDAPLGEDAEAYYVRAWKTLSVQLDCKSLVLSQFMSLKDYAVFQRDQIKLLLDKRERLKKNAEKLSMHLKQKEMLWAQINASKRITTAKELVSHCHCFCCFSLLLSPSLIPFFQSLCFLCS